MAQDRPVVLIPSFRGAARIGETLQSIATDAPGTEVVLVDDGSDDETATVARQAAAGLDLRVEHHARNRGRAAACNTALRATDADWVVILDDDMRVEPGFMASIRSAQMRQGAGRRVFLGRIRLTRHLADSAFTRFLRWEEEERHRKLLWQRDAVPWRYCLTGNFSARRVTLLELGGFDERITVYGFEDIEMGIRLHRAGIHLTYVPEAVSIHRAYAVELGRLRRRTYLSGKVAPHLARLHEDMPEVRAFLRIGGMGRIDLRRDSVFLVAMKLLNRLLQRPGVVGVLSSGRGERLLLGVVRVLERLPLRRVRHLAYHFVRDVAYYRGINDALGAASSPIRRPAQET